MKRVDIGAAGAAVKGFVLDVVTVYRILLKVMVPALIIVKALDLAGGTAWLAWLLAPAMSVVGLPGEMGIVWAAAILTNIYTAMIVYASLALSEPLTVAQVTVLGVMVLVAHSLPVEAAVAKAAGVSWRATLTLRLGGALALGGLLNLVYSTGGWLQTPSRLLWQPAAVEPGLAAWALDQLWMLAGIFFVIAVLMAILRLLRLLGIERLMHVLLAPVLKLIGIRREAANITIIGTTLGLSFGAGLLLKDARSGTLSRRDIFLTLGFLGLCHSLIEDTLLILLLGADLSGVLWARLAFALLVIGTLARLPAVSRRLAESPSGV
jgi:spore maturation protein SpmB